MLKQQLGQNVMNRPKLDSNLGGIIAAGAFHEKYQMFSNGNSTNFSTVPLRIIDIFTEADILNIKSWKKLNFRLSPREKMQEKNQDKSNMIFFEIMIY